MSRGESVQDLDYGGYVLLIQEGGRVRKVSWKGRPEFVSATVEPCNDRRSLLCVAIRPWIVSGKAEKVAMIYLFPHIERKGQLQLHS